MLPVVAVPSAWSSINWIDVIFILFVCAITVVGALINFVEPYLPVVVRQSFRHGKHSYKGAPNRLVQLTEIPKAWFRHFYVFAVLWSTVCMYLMVHVYVGGYRAPPTFVRMLDTLCGQSREVRTNPTTTFLAVLLLFVQCIRRFYETHFVQIFSSASRMNLSHYVVGYFHYFGAFVAIIAQAQGFNGDDEHLHQQQPIGFRLQWADCNALHWAAVGGFLVAWLAQFESNLILVRLRCNADGTVATQKHLMPVGGLFEYVSSPHMLCEMLMYVMLFVLVQNNSSWLFVLCWVLTNQIENAWLTHKWYLATFPAYPAKRRAILPFLL